MPRPSVPVLLACLAVLGAAAILAAHLVVTDEEAIEALVERAETAVASQDFDGLLDLLTEDFERFRQDRERTVAQLRSWWRDQRPTGLKSEILELKVAGNEARGSVQVDVYLLGRPWRLFLAADFVRTPDGWRIAGAAEERGPRPGSGS